MCSSGTGCGWDYHLVWTDTKGVVETVSEYYIVQGSTGKCQDSLDSSCTKRAAMKDERWNVRCCADSNPGNWRDMTKRKGCSVYTRSYTPHCISTDWDSGRAQCADKGGRLCTAHELEANCAKGGGCGFNGKMVWSSTSGKGLVFFYFLRKDTISIKTSKKG